MKATAHSIKGYATVSEALDASNLLFNPVKVPVMTGTGIDCPNHCAIVRDDTNTVLSVMGSDYTAFNTAQTFAVADILMAQNNLELTRAIETDGGKRIMVEMMGQEERTISRDTVRETYQIIDSFDGSKKFNIRFGFFRLICTNGLMIGEATTQLGVRHTKNAQDRLGEALRTWKRAALQMDQVRIRMEELTQKVVDKAMVDKFLNGLVGELTEKTSTRKKHQRTDLEQLFLNGRGNNGKTAWDLYNGAVEYYQHHTNENNPDARLASHLFETGHKQSQKAYSLANAL